MLLASVFISCDIKMVRQCYGPWVCDCVPKLLVAERDQACVDVIKWPFLCQKISVVFNVLIILHYDAIYLLPIVVNYSFIGLF